MLRFKNVSKVFSDKVCALDDVTLDIPRGEISALVGASGSGKTTLLRLAAGLETASSGKVIFENDTISRGYVFQAPTLMPWANVAENVGLPLSLSPPPLRGKIRDVAAPYSRLATVGEATLDGEKRGPSLSFAKRQGSGAKLRYLAREGSDEDAATLLTQVGLADKAFAMPHELSGGQQMRVSIARALASDPELLLLDEPFAALDEMTRSKLCDLVAQLQRERNLTILFVTHSLMEAVFLAKRVVLLSNHPGRIAQIVNIDGPTVRDQAFRSDPKFHQQCAALSALMAKHAD